MNNQAEWTNIFDMPQRIEVKISTRNPGAGSGTASYSSAGTITAAVIEKKYCSSDNFPQVDMTVLLPGVTPDVHPGDRININGTDHEIAAVKFCTSLDGVTLARRCTIR